MNNAKKCYSVDVERKRLNLLGLLKSVVTIFLVEEPVFDWKSSTVRIVDTDGRIVKRLEYGDSRDGAEAMRRVIEKDLEILSKDEFETQIATYRGRRDKG